MPADQVLAAGGRHVIAGGRPCDPAAGRERQRTARAAPRRPTPAANGSCRRRRRRRGSRPSALKSMPQAARLELGRFHNATCPSRRTRGHTSLSPRRNRTDRAELRASEPFVAVEADLEPLNFGSSVLPVGDRQAVDARRREAGGRAGEFAREPAATSNSTGLSSLKPKPKRTMAPSPEISKRLVQSYRAYRRCADPEESSPIAPELTSPNTGSAAAEGEYLRRKAGDPSLYSIETGMSGPRRRPFGSKWTQKIGATRHSKEPARGRPPRTCRRRGTNRHWRDCHLSRRQHPPRRSAPK